MAAGACPVVTTDADSAKQATGGQKLRNRVKHPQSAAWRRQIRRKYRSVDRIQPLLVQATWMIEGHSYTFARNGSIQ